MPTNTSGLADPRRASVTMLNAPSRTRLAIAAASEARTAAVARRSLVARCDIPKGTVLTEDQVVIQRPASGLPPSMLSQLCSRRLRVDRRAGEQFELVDFE